MNPANQAVYINEMLFLEGGLIVPAYPGGLMKAIRVSKFSDQIRIAAFRVNTGDLRVDGARPEGFQFKEHRIFSGQRLKIEPSEQVDYTLVLTLDGDNADPPRLLEPDGWLESRILVKCEFPDGQQFEEIYHLQLRFENEVNEASASEAETPLDLKPAEDVARSKRLSCFISYSTVDQVFADRLHAELQNHGVQCWFAPESLKIGDPFRQRIEDAIHRQDKLLVILSRNSVCSDWVREEVEACFERERLEKRLVLFPIRLDDAVVQAQQAWAASIRRQRHIGDFSRWETPDFYNQAFERLIKDLKAEELT